MRDAVGVEVEGPLAGALTGELDVALEGTEGIVQGVLAGVGPQTGKLGETAGVGSEPDAEVVVRALEGPEPKDLVR